MATNCIIIQLENKIIHDQHNAICLFYFRYLSHLAHAELHASNI